MSKLRILVLSACIAGLGLTTGGAGAAPAKKPDSDQEAALAALKRGEVMPLTKILAIAAVKVPGDVIRVKLERKPRGLVYELKILAKSGRVLEVHLDAKTGTLLDVEDD